MKITNVRSFLTSELGSPAVFVKIETDVGITGYGEATIHFFPQAVEGMLQGRPSQFSEI